MNKIVFLFVLSLLFSQAAYSYELDTSFDNEVRQKYNVEELNEENADKIKLPKLPDLPDDYVGNLPSLPETPAVNYQYFPENYTGAVKILKSGARFLVVNNKKITDTLPKGTVVTFYSLEDINYKGITIPQGTMFRGKIVSSHTPQMTGNGGLIKIEIDELAYDKTMYKINTVISKADDKRVFNGNIKGKRQYWSNVKRANKFGISTNKKMHKLGSEIGQCPVVGVVGVVPKAVGTVIATGNGVVSPFIAVFKKGAHSVIRRGTIFEIKLTQDVKLKA